MLGKLLSVWIIIFWLISFYLVSWQKSGWHPLTNKVQHCVPKPILADTITNTETRFLRKNPDTHFFHPKNSWNIFQIQITSLFWCPQGPQGTVLHFISERVSPRFLPWNQIKILSVRKVLFKLTAILPAHDNYNVNFPKLSKNWKF